MPNYEIYKILIHNKVILLMPESNKLSINIKENVIIWIPAIIALTGYLLAIEPRLVILEDHDITTKSHEARIASLEEFKATGPRFTGTDAEKAFSKLQSEQHTLNTAFTKLSSSVIRNEAKLDLIINKLEK